MLRNKKKQPGVLILGQQNCSVPAAEHSYESLQVELDEQYNCFCLVLGNDGCSYCGMPRGQSAKFECRSKSNIGQILCNVRSKSSQNRWTDVRRLRCFWKKTTVKYLSWLLVLTHFVYNSFHNALSIRNYLRFHLIRGKRSGRIHQSWDYGAIGLKWTRYPKSCRNPMAWCTPNLRCKKCWNSIWDHQTF